MIADLVIANLLRIARGGSRRRKPPRSRGNRNAVYLCEQAAEKIIRAVLTSEGKHAGDPAPSSTRWSTSSLTRTR